MKKFTLYIFKLLLILVASAYSLDFLYTKVYSTAKPQNKVQYINSLKNQKFDYIFIGSSRVENSVVATQIESKTNKKTINLGIKGLKLKDMSYIIRLLNSYNVSYKKLFIQIDYSFNHEEESSKFFSFELLPFCNSNNFIIDSYLKETYENYFIYKYVPFLKYANSDQLLGFRKIFSSVKNKKSIYNLNKGYLALEGISSNEPEKIPSFVETKNKYFNSINNFAQINNLNVVYFSSPIFIKTDNLVYFDKLKTVIPQVYNFHNSIIDDKCFYDKLHVNDNGAKAFTNILIEKLQL